jgi:virginiamycin A acetyltransferase
MDQEMIELTKSIMNTCLIYFMRRRQFDNIRLRKFFEDKYDISVGMYSYGCFDRWRMPGPLRIGRYCSIANTVRSSSSNHLLSAITTHPVLYEASFGAVHANLITNPIKIIHDDVWIGHNVLILPGCTSIGRGSVIGAGAVLTKDVAPYSVMVGNPGRLLRARFSPALIEQIERTNWWMLDIQGISKLIKTQPELLYNPTIQNLAPLINTGD